jgi:hypothetical protein
MGAMIAMVIVADLSTFEMLFHGDTMWGGLVGCNKNRVFV